MLKSSDELVDTFKTELKVQGRGFEGQVVQLN